MERADALDDALTEAVERVADQRRARHRTLLRPEPTTASLAERVVALPNGAGRAILGRTPSGWLPAGTVLDAILGEELRVWWRPRDGAVAAEVALDPIAAGGEPAEPAAPGKWTDSRDWRT
jgi:hypothetical protein